MPTKKKTPTELRVPAIEIRQSPGRKIYSFAVDGKLVHDFAAVSRIKRVEDGGLAGYQRPEVVNHIEEIRAYIDSDAPMIPNAVVIAFDKRVKFVPSASKSKASDPTYIKTGHLVIPKGPYSAGSKPGFVVDGQQRLAAVRDSHRKTFPLPVTAFITSNLEEQTEQFILVNATKPLPKGLIFELLPTTTGRLPTRFHKKKLPAMLLHRLNVDADSPLRGLINTPTCPGGVIRDNSMLQMLDASLTDGTLHSFWKRGDADISAMLATLKTFWSVVAETFPDAWGRPPRESRLMHGAGIVALGAVFDSVSVSPRVSSPDQSFVKLGATYERVIRQLSPRCAWTSGNWEFKNRSVKWNEIQNTRQDVAALADMLGSLAQQGV